MAANETTLAKGSLNLNIAYRPLLKLWMQVFIEERQRTEEKLNELNHSFQGADEETILAALLHDIGQFTTSPDQKQMICDASALNDLDPGAVDGAKQISVGVTGHERIGAVYLRQLGFSEKVAALVESHVPVKRYLTAKYPDYYDGLSGASKLSLKYQVS